MALLLIDGFDHYGTGDTDIMGSEFWFDNGGITRTNVSGRTGQCVEFLSAAGAYLRTAFFINQDSIYVGFARKGTSAGSDVADYPLMAFYADTAQRQCSIQFNSSGNFEFRRGSDTILGTSTSGFAADTWQYFEAYVKVGDSDGACIIKLNGAELLNLSGVDSQADASSDLIKSVLLGNHQDQVFYDDLYIDTAQFHGDCYVETVYPNADGATTDFTLSGGTTHWELLDEAVPDGDTTYTYTTTATHQELVEFTDFADDSGAFVGVLLDTRLRKLLAGSRKIKLRVNSGTVNDSSEKIVLTDWRGYQHIWETDPNTSLPWTRTNLGTADFGVLVQS